MSKPSAKSRSESSMKAAATRARNRLMGAVAAAFEWTGGMGGLSRPVWLAPKGGGTMIDLQKGRNNYYKMNVRDQASICRRMSERNWFLRPVLALRHASWSDDFRAINGKGEVMKGQYDFGKLVDDILWERLVSTNIVCLWRKGEDRPQITVLDAEAVDYKTVAGRERIVLQYAKDPEMAKDKENEATYRKLLGDKVYEAQTKGKSVTIVRGEDPDWDFETWIPGKRRGVFCIPEMVGILDTVDFMELMGIGDWNLAWFRKDVIRFLRKGYKVTHGQGSGVNSVDISTKQIKELGDGFSGLNGNANIPANHDVDPFYLTVDSKNFDPSQVESATERLLHYGGIEAVVLFGSFSQQNGAAPSLMRNARAMAFKARQDVEELLRRIFSRDEFRAIEWGTENDESGVPIMNFRWGVKSLYSLDELLSLQKGTSDGTASSQTRREWLGLDNEEEIRRNQAAHAARSGFAPAYETGQGLLPAMFPDELGSANAGASSPGEPGRPALPAET